MFNMVVKILQKMVEGRYELTVIGRHVLELIEIFFDLSRLSRIA